MQGMLLYLCYVEHVYMYTYHYIDVNSIIWIFFSVASGSQSDLDATWLAPRGKAAQVSGILCVLGNPRDKWAKGMCS